MISVSLLLSPERLRLCKKHFLSCFLKMEQHIAKKDTTQLSCSLYLKSEKYRVWRASVAWVRGTKLGKVLKTGSCRSRNQIRTRGLCSRSWRGGGGCRAQTRVSQTPAPKRSSQSFPGFSWLFSSVTLPRAAGPGMEVEAPVQERALGTTSTVTP